MRYLLPVFVLFIFISCAHVQKDKTIAGIDKSEEFLKNAKISFEKSYFAKSRRDKILNAKRGIIFAEECIKSSPENPGCYYYRAANTGLYYQARIVGYQKGLKQMINDCNKVIEFEPNYENSGAYLMLGQIYLQVPITAMRQGDIKRNINLANKYLSKAATISPNYPENHLYLANAQLEAGELELAKQELSVALKLMKNMGNSPYFDEWKKLANDIGMELKRNGI